MRNSFLEKIINIGKGKAKGERELAFGKLLGKLKPVPADAAVAAAASLLKI